MPKPAPKECAVIVGVGDRNGIGAAVAVLAASHGLHVFIAGRTKEKLNLIVDEVESHGGSATAVITDSTKAEEIERLFTEISQYNGVLKFVVYNTGRNIPAPFMESDERLFHGHFKRCVLGAMLVGQAAIRQMLEQGDSPHRGTIIYTGASASMRGKPLFAGFASAKAGARALAQSMAREFGPQGIHVGHIVIDGIVNGNIVNSLAGGLGKMMIRNKGADGALLPDAVAKAFWMLHEQAPSAWTHEMDLRPHGESF